MSIFWFLLGVLSAFVVSFLVCFIWAFFTPGEEDTFVRHSVKRHIYEQALRGVDEEEG